GAAALHGNKQQGLRTNVLAGFRQGAFGVLVATDVAARGLHIDDVTMVVHVDPASDVKEYVHRSGRTAPAGAAGPVVTLVLPHQVGPTRKVLEGAEVDGNWAEVPHAGAAALADLGGNRPPGEPVADPARTKYKGAPRKLDPNRRRGADARRAAERRANEERRAAWDEPAPPGRRGSGGTGRGPSRGARGRSRARRRKGGR